MDFVAVKAKNTKNGMEIYPDFLVCRSKDIMVRGKSFYAVWDESAGMWSTDEYDVQRLVDNEIAKETERLRSIADKGISSKYMRDYSSKSWSEFKDYTKKLSDNSHQLDTKITFANTEVKKTDYISRRLPYSLDDGKCPAYEELISTLYEPEERRKLEWAIGSIIAGDAKTIQKFLVLYGDAGAGKSTILNIIQKIFEGYYTVFDAKSLTNSNNSFSTEQFRDNPLVAIQHDGDLSKIEDNSKLNSIISHEEIVINEKFKSGYSMKLNCFLFMATNKPVKITDAKSGIIRRLIDVKPSGRKVPEDRYMELVEQVNFELGSIAYHCLEVYKAMGKNYYQGYRPIEMMYKTDPFFNFVEDCYYIFLDQEMVTLKQAYALYKEYCNDTGASYVLQQYKFREELKNYFRGFEEEVRTDDGKHLRSVYYNFNTDRFKKEAKINSISIKKKIFEFKEQPSLFDRECANCIAQYGTSKEIPAKKWENVTTVLSDLDTSKLHYVKVPENHIVIDFDIKDEKGNKSFELNLEAANKWPLTYAELSKSGQGIHLHYIYTGDVNQLSRVYDDNIEIKVFNGNSSLRRKLIKCNDIPIAKINSGLPLKESKGDKMVNYESVKTEKGLRTLIAKNLNKEIHPGTKPSIDFILKILNDAYDSGLKYDVTDMRQAVLNFASNSSHQAEYCMKAVNKMKFKSEESSDAVVSEGPLIFYDVEVFPNLFLINWKQEGEGHPVHRMINPTPADVEEFLKFRLVGFNCRRYDNHILYGRFMGYTNEQLYNLSQKIVSGSKNAFFGEAYNLSYTDVYDFSSKKQSLKKFEIELGLHHQELGLPWDQPVPEDMWEKVAEYCDNDVISTEATFNARKQDFIARQILADIAGMTVNDTTNSLTTRIIFGKERHPELVYTDLSKTFPGYEFTPDKKNMYRGVDLGFGGYVYAEPGIYGNVALLDVTSLHPHSIINMNVFGDYTKNFADLLNARVMIKHKDFAGAKELLNGALAPYLKDEDQAADLAQALKIAINSVYGLTSATFDNPFKDPRNENNIVALRGALFMKTLQDEVQKQGFTVAHIKTDSIKIPNATPEIIDFCMKFAKKYGYSFEHEATYEKMCLVNDAVYIAKYSDMENINGKHAGEWTATGTQFQVPYVFKTLFSKESIEFDDLCETKSVSSSLYLDMNEQLPDVGDYEKEYAERVKGKLTNNPNMRSVTDDELKNIIASGHDYHFVGKVGQFCPIKKGCGGGLLMREKDGKYYAATGTKGYRWLESEMVKTLEKEDCIDRTYYNKLVDDAIETISQYGDFEWFASNDPYSEVPFVEN